MTDNEMVIIISVFGFIITIGFLSLFDLIIEDKINKQTGCPKTKHKVITLCGSTKFKDQFLEVQKKLTLEGNIVLSLGLFGHSGDEEALNKETQQMLIEMHRQKIDMSDEIFVINVDGYIGESTKEEIEYAKRKRIPIRYYS